YNSRLLASIRGCTVFDSLARVLSGVGPQKAQKAQKLGFSGFCVFCAFCGEGWLEPDLGDEFAKAQGVGGGVLRAQKNAARSGRRFCGRGRLPVVSGLGGTTAATGGG